MQTLLAPLRPSRSRFARLSVALRSSLRRLLAGLRRLLRRAARSAVAGTGTWPSLIRDPGVDAWLALSEQRRQRRRLPAGSPREGAKVIPLRPMLTDAPVEASCSDDYAVTGQVLSAEEPEDSGPHPEPAVTLRITM